MTQGPLPLTNGWFARFSGRAATPPTAWFFKRALRVSLTARVRIAAAVGFVGHP